MQESIKITIEKQKSRAIIEKKGTSQIHAKENAWYKDYKKEMEEIKERKRGYIKFEGSSALKA